MGKHGGMGELMKVWGLCAAGVQSPVRLGLQFCYKEKYFS